MIITPWPSATHDSMITCDMSSARDAKSVLFDFYHSEWSKNTIKFELTENLPDDKS